MTSPKLVPGLLAAVLVVLGAGAIAVHARQLPQEVVGVQAGSEPVDHDVDDGRSLRWLGRPDFAAIAERLTAPPPPEPPAVPPPSRLTMPAAGPVTSRFGPRWGRAHTGIDLGAVRGSAAVAAAAGRVAFTGWKNGYGNTVVVDHGAGLSTLYAHLDAIEAAPGMVVVQGQRVGAVGASGAVTGVNLHYEVLVDGVPQDPLQST